MYATLIYGFPVMLTMFEWGFRRALAEDSVSFAGPSLCIAAISFLIPLIKPKYLEIDGVQQFIGRKRIRIVAESDDQFIAFTHIILYISIFVWGISLFMSIKHPSNWSHLALGATLYVVSLSLVAIKEKMS